MSLIVGTNSWVSVAQADAYLTDVPEATDWFNLVEDPIEAGGEAKTSYLILSFRTLVTHPDLNGLSASTTDEKVNDAQIELALYLLRYREDFEQRSMLMSSGVQEFDMGEWSEKFKDSGGSLSTSILSLLSTYVTYGNVSVQLRPENYVE